MRRPHRLGSGHRPAHHGARLHHGSGAQLRLSLGRRSRPGLRLGFRLGSRPRHRGSQGRRRRRLRSNRSDSLSRSGRLSRRRRGCRVRCRRSGSGYGARLRLDGCHARCGSALERQRVTVHRGLCSWMSGHTGARPSRSALHSRRSGQQLGHQQHDQRHEDDGARQSFFHCGEYTPSHSSAGPTVYTEPHTMTRSPGCAAARAAAQASVTVSNSRGARATD